MSVMGALMITFFLYHMDFIWKCSIREIDDKTEQHHSDLVCDFKTDVGKWTLYCVIMYREYRNRKVLLISCSAGNI